MYTSGILLPAMAYAALGLLASLIVHGFAVAGLTPFGMTAFFVLHVGIFPLWFLVVPVGWRLADGQRDWRSQYQILKLAPDWLRYLVIACYLYTLVHFALMFFGVALNDLPQGSGVPGGLAKDKTPPPHVTRLFSAVWMLFFASGLAILAAARKHGIEPRRCSNGHDVRGTDQFCSECGIGLARLS